MPPLILHNVPDDELYVGEDGIQRPYAMVFPGNEGNPVARTRRTVAETGSFGKSTRRSRSRTATPAAKREDPTLAAADAIFSGFLASRAAAPSENNTQRTSTLSGSVSQPNLSTAGALAPIDNNSQTPARFVHKEPTEIILRGFKARCEYAAIREYERIGGRICEHYSRDPDPSQRVYKNDIRDQAVLRNQPMTAEEKAKALHYDGGEHWIKVTFESAEGADAALDASPQNIQGHLVYAEPYRGIPPTADQEIIATAARRAPRSLGVSSGLSQESIFGTQQRSSTLPRSFTTPSMSQIQHPSVSPPGSNTSSNTLDTGTLSAAGTTASSATLVGQPAPIVADEIYCRRIPTAKRARLLPAEQALLPQKTVTQQIMSQIPFLSLLGGDVIGSQVPRDEQGKFDWAHASFYWKVIWFLDSYLGYFDVVDPPVGKEE